MCGYEHTPRWKGNAWQRRLVAAPVKRAEKAAIGRVLFRHPTTGEVSRHRKQQRELHSDNLALLDLIDMNVC